MQSISHWTPNKCCKVRNPRHIPVYYLNFEKSATSSVESMVRDSTRPTDRKKPLTKASGQLLAHYYLMAPNAPKHYFYGSVTHMTHVTHVTQFTLLGPFMWPSFDPHWPDLTQIRPCITHVVSHSTFVAHISAFQLHFTSFCGTCITTYTHYTAFRHTTWTFQPEWTSWNAIPTLHSVHIIQLHLSLSTLLSSFMLCYTLMTHILHQNTLEGWNMALTVYTYRIKFLYHALCTYFEYIEFHMLVTRSHLQCQSTWIHVLTSFYWKYLGFVRTWLIAYSLKYLVNLIERLWFTRYMTDYTKAAPLYRKRGT